MAERFYLNCELAPGPVVLRGPEAHHLATVCRLRPGDAVCLFNGDGREYPARVEAVSRRDVALTVLGTAAPPREVGFRLEVAAPLPKGDRGSFLVEKLTEVGVTRFVPLRTERSVVEPREAKLEKLQRQVIEASKQCGRNVLMEVAPLAAWADFCRRAELPPRRLLAHPSDHPSRRLHPAGDVVLAVGPEGGFTEQEAIDAVAAGWQAVSLGPRILRVETAAVVLASWVSCAG
jgi:16S rRNA (uracil1498-N3)-methyltransferase